MRTGVLLFIAALAVRAATGWLHPDPAYPDAHYYLNVARQLAAGNGFSVDYIWNFVDVGGRLPPAAVLPIPSNGHWMPLAALVQVPFILLLGASPIAAGLPFWVIGATAAPITYALGLDAGLHRSQAIAAGLFATAPGALTPFLAQPDNFALFMPLGALALWACSRALDGDARAFLVGGALVGLATLARNDGVLLAVPFVFAAALATVGRGPGVARREPWRARLTRLLVGMTFFVAAFLVVAGPWYARQLAVFGSLSPSAANGRILWITTYQELWSVGSDSSLAAFLGQGPDSLLASRLGGLAAALLIFAGVPLLLYLAPLTAVGAWVRGRDRLFLPWSIYALTLLAVNALLFAVHVPYGTFLHSAGALVPHAYVLAVGGVSVAVAWVARRRSSWQVQRATRNFTALAVGVMFLGAAGAVWRIHSTWSAEAAIRQRISDSLPAHARSDVVMSPDPGAYRYLAGVRGVVTPDDPLPVIREAAAAYGVRWLILERAHVVDALAPVVAGEQRPEWLSRPLTEVGGRPPSAALFAVCLEPRDERCRG